MTSCKLWSIEKSHYVKLPWQKNFRNSTNSGPANMAEKKKKFDLYDFPLKDCIQEENGCPYFSSLPSLSRTFVEIQKFCYHGN